MEPRLPFNLPPPSPAAGTEERGARAGRPEEAEEGWAVVDHGDGLGASAWGNEEKRGPCMDGGFQEEEEAEDEARGVKGSAREDKEALVLPCPFWRPREEGKEGASAEKAFSLGLAPIDSELEGPPRPTWGVMVLVLPPPELLPLLLDAVFAKLNPAKGLEAGSWDPRAGADDPAEDNEPSPPENRREALTILRVFRTLRADIGGCGGGRRNKIEYRRHENKALASHMPRLVMTKSDTRFAGQKNPPPIRQGSVPRKDDYEAITTM